LVINPPPGSETVIFPTNEGPFAGNFHVVYTDGNFVFDPRWADSPMPIETWLAELKTLNRVDVEPEIWPAQP